MDLRAGRTARNTLSQASYSSGEAALCPRTRDSQLPSGCLAGMRMIPSSRRRGQRVGADLPGLFQADICLLKSPLHPKAVRPNSKVEILQQDHLLALREEKQSCVQTLRESPRQDENTGVARFGSKSGQRGLRISLPELTCLSRDFRRFVSENILNNN